MFKRCRHNIVHKNTVIDRPRGFAIVARKKVPRLGTKGCGRLSGFSGPPYISERCDVGALGSLSLVSSEPACTCSLRGAVLSVADLFSTVLARRFTCDIGCEL